MPILVRIIIQRLLAVFIGFLAFLGINPTIPTDTEIAGFNKQREEIVENILTDVEHRNINIDKNLIESLLEPEKNKEQNKNEPVIKKDAPPAKPEATAPKKEVVNTIIPQTIDQEKIPTIKEPVDVVIETVAEKIGIKDQKTLELENILVNIICTEKKGNYVTANTGSGVIVSPGGVVITNAHVGQYFLLDKELNDYSCALYQENIPTYGYVAELIYISPDWIKENKDVIRSKNPRGTGENDYAFLHITKNTNPALPKPKNFQYANLNTSYNAEIGQKIDVAGFPGAPASILDLERTVGLKTDSSNIKDIFTFGQNNADVISTGVTKVAARGASGGGVFKNNDLIALIVTTGGSENKSYINAITTNYINRDLKNDFNKSIFDLINSDLEKESDSFWKDYGKSLAEIILAEL
jgi:hypothetical protein